MITLGNSNWGRPAKRFGSTFAFAIILTVVAVHGAAQPGADGSKAVGRVKPLEPLPASDTAGNSGLFVGVGKFDSRFGLPALRFTTDDAIALAYEFAVDLKVIPPQRTILAIGGTPESAAANLKLKELDRIGIKRITATKADLLDAISQVTESVTDSNAIIVMSFSTHGFEKEGRAYVMPFDGNRKEVEETGIGLLTIKNRMRGSKANKKLLIVDACRESPKAETRGANRMSEQLLEALRTAEGMATMSSCAVGQLSWEADELQQGVFTHFLIEALEGAAPADPRSGLIRLDQVAEYATKETKNWVRQNKGENQEPYFEGGVARQMPLAYSRLGREASGKLNQRLVEARRHLGEIYFDPGNLLPDRVLQGAQEALSYLGGDDLEELLTNIDGLSVTKPAGIRLFVSWWDKWWPARRPNQ